MVYKSGQPKPITIKGKRFVSINEAARAHKINPKVVFARIKSGKSLDEVFGYKSLEYKSKPKLIKINGKNFKSLAHASSYYKVDKGTVYVRLRVYGWSLKEALGIEPRRDYEPGTAGYIYLIKNKVNKKNYIGITMGSLKRRWEQHIDNAYSEKKHHPNSLAQAIKEYKPRSFMLRKIDKASNIGELSIKENKWIKFYKSKSPFGYNLTGGGGGTLTKGKRIIVENQSFRSITFACRHYGLNTESQRREVSRRIKSGWTPEEAFGLIKKKNFTPKIKRKFKLQGKNFVGYSDAKKHFKTKASLSLIASRIRIWGWSLEEAFEIKKRKNPIHQEVLFRGKKFTTEKSLCDFYGIDYNSYRRKKANGASIKERLGLK